ncbi:MAG: hypothetical protein ACKO43_01505 [Alphaproteobacteria bacterium]
MKQGISAAAALMVLMLGACASDEDTAPVTRTLDARWQGITALPCGGNKQDVAERPLADVLKTASTLVLYPEQQTSLPSASPDAVTLIVAEPAMARYHPLLRDALNQTTLAADNTYCVYDPAAVFEAAGLPQSTTKPQTLALDDRGNVVSRGNL